MMEKASAAIAVVLAASLWGADRKVDPTFVHRYLPDVTPAAAELSTGTCAYKPLFGAGDANSEVVRGVARYGELVVASNGACKRARYPHEEQVYVVLAGTGALKHSRGTTPLRESDFLYLPPGTEYAVANPSGSPLRLMVMGFKVAASAPIEPTEIQIANLDDVKKQTVSGHPDSVLYQLMIGDVNSKRDRIAAGRVLTSLFVMDFAPGGTNFPHHHDSEEEIYLVLDGTGEMVAGSGTDGIEGRFPARAGDAYFFRLNCTVGFYNSRAAGARILAVRSVYPRAR